MKKKSAKKTTRKTAAESMDLVDLILRDHKPLKRLIKTMKSENVELSRKREAFEEFAPMLMAHAKPEEQTLYHNMQAEEDMNVEALEGFTEHALADTLIEQLKGEEDDDTFEAKVKVLAELVEHHVEEEEEDMLPSYRHRSTKDQRSELGRMYEELHLRLQEEELPSFMKDQRGAETSRHAH